MSLSEREALLRALKRHESAATELGVAMYRPHKKQALFHSLGNIKFRYVRTGNRFGKSDMGSAEDVAWALGERPWISKNDSARYLGIPQKATKGIILCADWDKAEEIFTSETVGKTQGKLWKWIPKASFVRRDTNHSGNINKITVRSRWGGESTIYMGTVAGFKLNEQKSESAWYDWIHVDEPIPEEMWNGYSRGLMDTDGSAWFTCTPLCQPWINRFFYSSSRVKLQNDAPNFFADANVKDEQGIPIVNRVVIIGSSLDNPYISKQGIRQYVSGLSDNERAARLLGVPMNESGRVHWPFEEDEHVYDVPPPGWSDINTPPLNYTVRYHLDWHTRTNLAVIFSATSPEGTVYFFNEIWAQATSYELATQILDIIRPYFVAAQWCEPNAFIKTMEDDSSYADKLKEHGLNVEKGSKDLTRGIRITNDMLQQPGKLKFAANLERTLKEFDYYIYGDPERSPDKPKDADDHMMEGVHRILLGGTDYIDLKEFDMAYVEKPNTYLEI